MEEGGWRRGGLGGGGRLMALELCDSLKLNKQVNTIPWQSFTQESADVDRLG